MKITIFTIIFFASSALFAQEVRFGSGDQRIKVFKGQTVRIASDSAYVISSDRARLLNERLKELEQAQATNNQLADVNDELLSHIKEIESLVSELLRKMQGDTGEVTLDFETILAELDKSLNTMKENNRVLEDNNKELGRQLTEMKHTIKVLKKEIRGIWWNGITDKIVIGVTGIGLGLLIGSF